MLDYAAITDLPSAPPGPLYRWPGLKVPVGCDINSKVMSIYTVDFIFDSLVFRLLSWAIIYMGLDQNIDQGYQRHGP
jgi:hypothetical protein